MTPTKPRLHLPDSYLHKVQDILHAHLPQAEVWAYGSRVNGDYYEASDLDLVARQPGDLACSQPNLSLPLKRFPKATSPLWCN